MTSNHHALYDLGYTRTTMALNKEKQDREVEQLSLIHISLIVWNNTLVDGHNRYAILQKHPEICFSTMPLRFESREEVLAWICKNQLGRRNLTPEQKLFLIGKQYEAEKSSHGEARKESHDENGRFHRSSQTDNSGEAMKTCERIAEENGVSKATVLRASKYMKGVEIAESLIPGMREKILNKQVKVSKADMHRLARANYDARAQTLQEILHPELKVEPKPDADGIIREPGKAPVLPFQKIESVYDSDAYPEEVRHDYVALEHVTTRFRTEFDYLLRTMPDTAQREVILEIIHKHKEYLASLESALDGLAIQFGVCRDPSLFSRPVRHGNRKLSEHLVQRHVPVFCLCPVSYTHLDVYKRQQESFHVDHLHISEYQIPAIADLQLGKLRRSFRQFFGAVRRDLLIPPIPVSLAAARCQLQDDILLRLEFGIVAELAADTEIRLALPEHRLLHVGPVSYTHLDVYKRQSLRCLYVPRRFHRQQAEV